MIISSAYTDKKQVVVIGAGYVGLTTGAVLAYTGHKVTFLDLDERRIESLRRGITPIHEAGLEEMLEEVSANINCTTSYEEAVPGADVVFLAVGTPTLADGKSDLSYLRDAAEKTGKHIASPLTVVVIKSTVPVGTNGLIRALIQDAVCGRRDGPPSRFVVASNPEFLREGYALHDMLYPDRIVIGAEDEVGLQSLISLYRPVIEQTFPAPAYLARPESLDTVPVITTTPTSAELTKYASNAFLALKISFINEIGTLAERVGADILEIGKALGLDSRIGTRFLQPGIGWGGSCFGKDTQALLTTADNYRLEMPIVTAARQVNTRQRTAVVEKLQETLKTLGGRTIGLLGLAFKPHTNDVRDAPALDIARKLTALGARVRAHDPVAMEHARRELADIPVTFHTDLVELARDADALVLATEWPQYRNQPWTEIAAVMPNPILLDGRNMFAHEDFAGYGFKYIGMGR